MKAHVEASELIGANWRKSSYSGPNSDNCVEVADFDGGKVVRNSNDPASGAIRFTADEWSAFVQGAAAGEFDA